MKSIIISIIVLFYIPSFAALNADYNESNKVTPCSLKKSNSLSKKTANEIAQKITEYQKIVSLQNNDANLRYCLNSQFNASDMVVNGSKFRASNWNQKDLSKTIVDLCSSPAGDKSDGSCKASSQNNQKFALNDGLISCYRDLAKNTYQVRFDKFLFNVQNENVTLSHADEPTKVVTADDCTNYTKYKRKTAQRKICISMYNPHGANLCSITKGDMHYMFLVDTNSDKSFEIKDVSFNAHGLDNSRMPASEKPN